MKHLLKGITLTLVATSLLAGAAFAATPTPTKAININVTESLIANKKIEVLNLENQLKIGSEMVTEIYDNPSTGYEWKISVTGDSKAISYSLKEKEVKVDPKAEVKPAICGEGAYKNLVVKGLKAGKATIKMTLVRPWEKNAEPAQTMEFIVNVVAK